MALALLVAISGPKKVLIFRPHPFQWALKWIFLQQNYYVPRHIYNRYINSYSVSLRYSTGDSTIGLGKCLLPSGRSAAWPVRFLNSLSSAFTDNWRKSVNIQHSHCSGSGSVARSQPDSDLDMTCFKNFLLNGPFHL
jgi:hypothetical protein